MTSGSRLKHLIRLIQSPTELTLFFRESPRFQKLLRRLPAYASLTFVTLVLYMAALLTWKIIPVPVLQAPIADSTIHKNTPGSTVTRFTAVQIGRWALFGQANNKTKSVVIKPTQTIRETKVKIGLIGIVFSAHEHENRIIVKNSRKGDQLYKTGGILPGNIKVKSIHANHVILIINNVPVRKTLKTVEARETRKKKGKVSQKKN